MHGETEENLRGRFLKCIIVQLPMLTLQTASDTSTTYAQAASYRLTQVGILRALTWPGFFLSTFLGSRVMVPAKK